MEHSVVRSTAVLPPRPRAADGVTEGLEGAGAITAYDLDRITTARAAVVNPVLPMHEADRERRRPT